MVSVTQKIPEFALSSQLNEIVINADEEVTFILKKNDSVILQESYTPDSQNIIRILDLFSLLESYLINEPLTNFTYEMIADSLWDNSTNFTVLLCRPIEAVSK